METTKEIKVKGRWIKRTCDDRKMVFLFSKPRNVCLWFNKRREATAVFLGQMTIVGGEKVSCPMEGNSGTTNKKWCVVSSRKFYHVSELA